MKKRSVLTLLLVGPLAAAAASPLGLELCRQAFAAGVRAILGLPVALAPPSFYFVGASSYHVDFWCTPAVLWLGAALLLLASRPDMRSYLRGLALILPLSAAAMVANVVLSIALHQNGVPWTWAHYPGLLLIYAAVFLYCSRRPRASAALAAQPGV